MLKEETVHIYLETALKLYQSNIYDDVNWCYSDPQKLHV